MTRATATHVLRLTAAAAILFLLWLPLRSEPPCGAPGARADCPPPPCALWEAQMERLGGGAAAATATATATATANAPPDDPAAQAEPAAHAEGDAEAKGDAACPPPPPPPPNKSALRPKGDLYLMRHPELAASFFQTPDHARLQGALIAAELTVDREARLAAFATAAASGDPLIRWRSAIGAGRTLLAYGDAEGARAEASAALDAAVNGGLDPRAQSDAYFILALTDAETETALRDLHAATAADPFFFDAHLAILTRVAQALPRENDPAARLALLDEALRSVEFLSTLEDPNLLGELIFAFNQSTATLSPEGMLLLAYAHHFTGGTEAVAALTARARALCAPPVEPARAPLCARFQDFEAALARSRAATP